MSIINWFNKPKWKNKDAKIRAIAINTDDSTELKAQLTNISQNDESELVRSAALKRLDDYTLIAKIAENDTHKSVKNSAYKILQDWFKNNDSEQQLQIIKKINDNTTIELAASLSSNKEMRQYCINKITKQGLLGDLLLNEKDKDLRQLIVSKINKPATLKRIAKLIKNKDKTSFKAIQEKLEDDGDIIKIINSKALELCEQMEKLIHNPNTSNKADVDKINIKWLELKKDNTLNKFTQRFEGAYRTASLTFDPKQRDEFLTQQRQQRINSKISELKTSLKDHQNASWEELQTQISKYSGFDLTHANSEQNTEFETLLNELKTQRDSQSKQQDLPEKLLEIADKLDATLKHKYNQPNQIVEFRKLWDRHASSATKNTAFNTLRLRFDKAILNLAEKVENSAKLRDEAAKNAVTALPQAKALIKDGSLAEAKIAINKIATNKKIAGFHQLIKDNKFEFDAVWNELKELRKWQTWSNDKIRIRIIEELKQLIGTGTHPDAILKKMKESNSQWKDMEEHEKLEGDRYGIRNMELYSQFRTVQEILFKPAQKFFEKRSEIWGNELAQVEVSIKELHEVNLQETSDRDLSHMVRNAIKLLRNLDKIPPKVRGKCAAKIRSGTARIDAHLKESYKVAERRKQKLIEHALELVELEDLDAAIEQAKALQQDWKGAGIIHQTQERKLWKAFRKANDAVFNRIKIQRDQVKQENQELIGQASLLISECETNIKKEKTAHNINSLIEKFKDDWSALKIENRGLLNKADKLIESSQIKIASLANSETVDLLKNIQKHAIVCQNLELEKIDTNQAQQKWGKLKPISNKKSNAKLDKRFQQALSEKNNANYIQTAATILIAAEYLSGIASPDEYKDQRLAYQVEELSKRMSGEESTDSTDKAQQLLLDWFSLNGADANFIKTNDKRIKQVIKSLFELLK